MLKAVQLNTYNRILCIPCSCVILRRFLKPSNGINNACGPPHFLYSTKTVPHSKRGGLLHFNSHNDIKRYERLAFTLSINRQYKTVSHVDYHRHQYKRQCTAAEHTRKPCQRFLCNLVQRTHHRALTTGAHQMPNPYDAEFIRMNTEISIEHLTPEIKLHLITPNCPLWKSKGDECPVPDPFWAFYWPGGQALTRYILDHPWFVEGKTVLDVGSGCGASAIAATRSGARHVLANDICKVATSAIAMNAKLNNLSISVCTDNLIGQVSSEWDIVLLGDMFYDDVFTEVLGKWIDRLKNKKKTVVVGDPGRIPFMQHPVKRKLELIAMYDLPPQAMQENNGMTSGHVWACK